MTTAVLLCLLYFGAGQAPPGGTPPRRPQPNMFPQKFSVVTGTTIPLNHGWDSVTQTGVIHYDGVKQFLRMDHKGNGAEVTLIGRFGEGSLLLVSGGSCVNVTVNGTLMPFATPKGSVLNQERMMVRDTHVVNYNGVMRGNDGKLHELDFFVKKYNRTDATDLENWLPWRISYSKARRREIAPAGSGAPFEDEDENDDRDWRFYDEMHPDDDDDDKQVAPARPQDHPLATLDPISKITTDFYNFHKGEPHASLFDPPEICADATSKDDVKFSFTDTAPYGHQIFEFQKVCFLKGLRGSEGVSYKIIIMTIHPADPVRPVCWCKRVLEASGRCLLPLLL